MDKLRDIRARAEGCDSLVISSENFSYALDDDLCDIRKIFNGDEVHLIFTAAPLLKRAISLWTANVQLGSRAAITEARDSIVAHETFDTEYFDHMIGALDPACASLIVTDPKNPPEALLTNFLEVCNLSIGDVYLS